MFPKEILKVFSRSIRKMICASSLYSKFPIKENIFSNTNYVYNMYKLISCDFQPFSFLLSTVFTLLFSILYTILHKFLKLYSKNQIKII